ncbi:MAG: tetratricopeptide repeat protein [Nitrospirae bacterium]|jgi:tetratricopeptide (TPR) repeat protein|nr:tetratricopeptide repeat protein [Nitrospirota bacterium]
MTPEEIVALEERLEGNPKSRSFLQLAEAYLESGAVEKALPLLNKGVEYYPYYLAARITLGQVQKSQGLLDDALRNFEFVTRTIPDNLVAQKNLADIYFRKGDREKAFDALKMALSLSPGDPDLLDLENRLKDASSGPASVEPPTGTSPEPPLPPDGTQEPIAITDEPIVDSEEPILDLEPEPTAETVSDSPDPVIETFGSEPSEGEGMTEDVPAEPPTEPLENEELPDDDELLRMIPRTETMGDLFMSQKRFPQAEKIYDSLLAENPEDPRLLRKRESARKHLPLAPEDIPASEKESGAILEKPFGQDSPLSPEQTPLPVSPIEQKPEIPEREEPVTQKSPAVSPDLKTPQPLPSIEDDRLIALLKERLHRDLIGVIVASENGLALTGQSGEENSDVLAAEGIELLRQLEDLAFALGQGTPIDGFVWLENSILYFLNRPGKGGLFLWLNAHANIGRCRLVIRQETGLSPGNGTSR